MRIKYIIYGLPNNINKQATDYMLYFSQYYAMCNHILKGR